MRRRAGVGRAKSHNIKKVPVFGFPCLDELTRLGIAELELIRCYCSAEEFVNQPEAICVEQVGFAVLSHLLDSARSHNLIDLRAIDALRLSARAHDLADLVQLYLSARTVGPEHV